ncbi:hypothetical protein SAMN05216533_0676 [Streptomyces sp. Ag109_O5-10]|nr:hypothetical protein SAMN05216533_0676 [Streptomyces sp. Ag109_O5-10]
MRRPRCDHAISNPRSNRQPRKRITSRMAVESLVFQAAWWMAMSVGAVGLHAPILPAPRLWSVVRGHREPAQLDRAGVEGGGVESSHVFADEIAVEPLGKAHVVTCPATFAVFDQEPGAVPCAAARKRVSPRSAPAIGHSPSRVPKVNSASPNSRRGSSSGSRSSQHTPDHARTLSRMRWPGFQRFGQDQSAQFAPCPGSTPLGESSEVRSDQTGRGATATSTMAITAFSLVIKPVDSTS